MADRLLPLETSYAYLQGRCGGFDGETTCDRPRGHADHCRLYDPSGSGRWVEKDGDGMVVRRGGGPGSQPEPLIDVLRDHADEPALASCSDPAHIAAGWHNGSSCAAPSTDGLLEEGAPLYADDGEPHGDPCACGDVPDLPPTGVGATPDGRAHGRLLCHRRPAELLPLPSCGDVQPSPFAGVPMGPCQHPVGHLGIHRDSRGAEWGNRAPTAATISRAWGAGYAAGVDAAIAVAGTALPGMVSQLRELLPGPPPSQARMRVGRTVGRTLYLTDPTAPGHEGVLIGMVDTPELAAELARRWNAGAP